MIYKEQENKWYKDQIDRIESLKKEHVETKEILSSITQTLEKEILLPLSSVAFVKASIYHTNETMINLGNDYFVERSVHQAQQIVQRRIDVLDDGIKRLRDEFEEKKDLGVTMQMEDGAIEIIEPYVEEEEKPKPKPVEKKPVGESILKKKEPEAKEVQKIEPQAPKFEEVKQEAIPVPVKQMEKEKEREVKQVEEKKKVSFSQEVETKELPKKVSKFKQEMMDRKKQG